MINFTLYKRELRRSILTLVIFGAVMTLYISIIVSMYNPEMMQSLEEMRKMLPELMSAVGMKAGANSLLGFMSSYLDGFILIIFPMVFSILRGNALIAKYVDSNAMVALLAAPIKRRTIVMTQMSVLLTGIFFLIIYGTALEILCGLQFKGELEIPKLLLLNGGLLCLQLFIAGISFLASCVFNDSKYSIAVGGGIPALMYVLQMLANTGGNAEKVKYFTFFTLFDPDALIAGDRSGLIGIFVLLIGACILFVASGMVFCKKDLHI